MLERESCGALHVQLVLLEGATCVGCADVDARSVYLNVRTITRISNERCTRYSRGLIAAGPLI